LKRAKRRFGQGPAWQRKNEKLGGHGTDVPTDKTNVNGGTQHAAGTSIRSWKGTGSSKITGGGELREEGKIQSH